METEEEYDDSYFRCRMNDWDEFKAFCEACSKHSLNYS